MAEEGDFNPNELVGEIVKGGLNSDPVKNLLGPVTKNIGSMLGLVSDIARFYTEENLKNIFTKWAERREGKPVEPEEFKRVLPFLQDAAMQSDDELQDRWAALLENVATETNGVLPSFGQTLAQITPAEARYLDRIWECVMAPNNFNSGKRLGRDSLSETDLANIYNPELRAPNPAQMRVYRDQMSPEQLAAYEEVTNFELVLHDLERLSLIEKELEYDSGKTKTFDIYGHTVVIPAEDSGINVSYALTQYGVNFILAVQPKCRPVA